ncbi:4-hydroxy-tetrahydrodipicolinate reductase [bacterium]|nr:4-hydroxy-tetrahydrodipicolinate reductase [bacterium]
MSAILLGLIGSAGRMGKALGAYLEGIDDIVLSATLPSGQPLADFISARPDAAVDLSAGPAVDGHGPAIVEAGIPYIIGATGFEAKTVDCLRKASEQSGSPVLIVPNFSIGANLMIRFAAAASAMMDTPVITERHHAGKADAPSGTARFTAERIAAAMQRSKPLGSGKAAAESLPGVMGGELEGVRVHSLRGEGFLAEQEVLFSLPGETLRIEHRSIDYGCFMPGIVYAIRNIGKVQGLQVGLDTIMDV